MKKTPLILLGVTIIALTTLAGLLSLMSRPPAMAEADSPAVPTASVSARPSNTPTPEPVSPANVAATIDGVPITYLDWQTATRLDAVMSQLTGQPVPSTDETLDRLIVEILLLRGADLNDATVSPAQIQAIIANLKTGWNLGDAEIVSALEANGLTRQALDERVARLILVEQAVQILSAQHLDLDTWLAQAHRSAQINLYQPLEPAPTAIVAAAPTATFTPAPTTAPTTQPSPTPLSAPPVMSQTKAIAPDFTLDSATGAPVTLGDYRDQSSVVLVFYRGQT